ncbi:MAG: rhomboid family intramembrane serine protease [Gemmatimonadota bacterium]|nr:rhomboid family intramembrane serine protease [Gemmatimonadota bacterium]
MTAPASAPLPTGPRSRLPRVVGWSLVAIAVVHFLQWTLLLPDYVQEFLGFRRGDLDAGKWWSVFTYPFVHADLASLLLSGYVLTVFGSRLEREWGPRRFLAFGFLASLGGWTLHLFIGGDALLLGAAAPAFAILAAHAMQWDDAEHPLAAGVAMRGRWMVLFIATLILLVGMRQPVGGGGAFLAHLGGVAAAWLFVRATQVTLVEQFREGVSALPDEPPDDQLPRAVPKTLPRSRARDRDTIDDVVARTNAAAARRTSPSRRRVTEQPRTASEPPTIDAILDKISAAGMDGLTDEERRVLDDHSRRLRDG